ncbi:MAG: 1-deoxy-D-xylulose-5-phosphate reductoisomerase [Sulfurospirillaceae bacterium]|nr:1-deoxy-D-xylulose-5-phosphate reductoisomerase [Sulfurospirillaceae bacterium]
MILLGSTGSIGVNALHVASRYGLHVEALSAGKNIKLLNEQIEIFRPKYVCIEEKESASLVKHERVFFGKEGLLEMLNLAKSDMVVNALVGFAGLAPTIETLRLGKKLALANKESLVTAGHLLDTSKIIPIDSEHFGLWYLLGERKVSRMTITASGGAFRDTPLERLPFMTPEEALKHPNWSMGRKITIDSATMTNKIFELLEAKWLFGCSVLDAIIETKSIIHALIDYEDGSTTAHIANADMKLPIAFALLGKVEDTILPHVNLCEVGSLSFKKIDSNRYPIWELKEDILQNPHLGVVLNAANEVGIAKFFEKEINICQIAELSKCAYKYFSKLKPASLDEVFDVDKEVRAYCQSLKLS